MTQHDSRFSARVDVVSRVAVVSITVLMAAVIGRIALLQTRPGEELASYAENRVSTRPVMGYRGEILDRRGRLLSTSRPGYRAFIDPERIDTDAIDELIVTIARVTGAEADEIGSRLLLALQKNRERRPASEEMFESPSPLEQLAAWWDGSVRAAPAEVDASDRLPLVRYVPVGDVLSEHEAVRVRAAAIRGLHLERCPVREYPGGDAVASLIGKVGFEHQGLMGAEFSMDESLGASDGRARYVRDASGRPLWIERGQWEPAAHGTSVRLSVDLELQRIATEELRRGIESADAAGGRLVMVDPASGEVLAMVDLYRDLGELPEFPWVEKQPVPGSPPPQRYDPWDAPRYRTLAPDPGRAVHPALGRNRCVEDVYEPGSTFKPFVWSLVTEAGLVAPDEQFDTEGGQWLMRRQGSARLIKDVTRRDRMTWTEVLVNSSNIGMIKGSSRMDHRALRDGLLRFGFSSRTGITLPGEAAGLMTSQEQWTHWTQESVSFGHEVAVTPVQMARAFCAFGRTGELAGTIPTLRLEAFGAEAGEVHVRALPADVATRARLATREVAAKAERNMELVNPDEPADGWRYQMFGKSGTAEIPLGRAPEGMRRPAGSTGYFDDQYNSSFAAGAPLESPRLVIVVVIDDPGPEAISLRRHYGSWVAAPVARRALERALVYLGVPADFAPSEDAEPTAVAAR